MSSSPCRAGGKEVRVGSAPGIEGVFQRAHNVLLTDDIVKALGAPLAIEGKITHTTHSRVCRDIFR